MVYKLKNLLPAAVMGLTLTAASNTAMAASVALSVNEITDFSMSSNGVMFTGFTFSNDTAATEGGGTGGADVEDAPAACVGDCGGWENQFFSHTPTTSTEFSYGDAEIINSDILTGTGAASSIGEVVVIDGIAHASGSNVMTSIFLSVVDSTVLDFSFNADALMQTIVTGTGLTSAANMFFNISLTDSDGEVFSWSPDGAVGGIFGGTEITDSFDLNYGISGNTIYNPEAGLFSASTDSLNAGNYTLNIKMENQVNGAATVVPVPAAVWLFGTGLLGLVGVARRRV